MIFKNIFKIDWPLNTSHLILFEPSFTDAIKNQFDEQP